MKCSRFGRRRFLRRCAAFSATLAWAPSLNAGETVDPAAWLESLEDPVRKLFPGTPSLDVVLGLFPRTTGQPAFDPAEIASNANKLRTSPEIKTGHPFLDLSVRTGLAHVDATFDGDHPKYGVGVYARPEHDGFPPTIIAAVDALSAWGLNERAAALFRYWLANFVRQDGTIDYYGPSISEYGQLLHTAGLLEQRAGAGGWWADGFRPLDRIAEMLLSLRADAGADGLVAGVPEADTRKQVSKYFHNNGWVAKGLGSWAALCERRDASATTKPEVVAGIAKGVAEDTLRALRATWPAEPGDWWLSPRVEATERPPRATGTRDASYTNYRYWPELLSSGVLPAALAGRVVNSRLTSGGQFCGMTRFEGHLDDWPLAEYLSGLWALGRSDDFLLSLYGHVAYHQAEGHLTAYEQITFPPGKKKADYCLPCQLVAARAARRLVRGPA